MRDSGPQKCRARLCGALFVAILVSATKLIAQPSGQWDFTTGDLTATVGADLQYQDGPGGATQQGTSFGTTTSFGIPDINGVVANVMKFPAAINGMGYWMLSPSTANGGGTLLNDYTLMFDLLYPQASDSKIRPLVDTDGNTFVAGPDVIINAQNALGTSPSGPFGGVIAPNTWHRVGIVVQQEVNTVTLYVDGQRVASTTVTGGSAGADGRFALVPNSQVLILADTDTNAAPGYVNSIQIRAQALNAGQMKALGSASAAGIPQTIPPVPSYIDSRTPDVDSKSEPPSPQIHVVLMAGDTTITGSSIQLYLDGTLLPATIAAALPNYTIDYAVTNILRPLSPHQVDLVYSDSVAGLLTNSWSFSIMNYQNVTLPAPFYLETFDELTEGTLPAGWVVTNRTDAQLSGFNLLEPRSDAYVDWVVVSTNTIASITLWDSARRLTLPPIVLNGVLLDSLAHKNFAYAESDQRANNQVQVMFTAQLDCTGRTNVYAAWHNIQEQNQDDIEAVEYSADGGTNWNPLVYFLPDSDGTDFSTGVVVTNNGHVDAIATFASTAHGPAWGLPYGTWIAAPITTNLAPYIVPQPDDEANITLESGVAHDAWIGKNIQVHRLPLADNSAHVMLRFMQAGTGSWYFGIDDFGLYSINTPVVTTQPASQTVDAGTPATFSVVASGAGSLSYQWEFNGNAIIGATNSTYTIQSAQPSNAGLYDVVVSNSDGPTTSGGAQLTLTTIPVITTQPLSQVGDAGDTLALTANFHGARPIGSFWQLDGGLVANSSATGITNTLTLSGTTPSQSGAYQLVVTNSYGAVTTAVAQVTVSSGSITNGLVVHLTFDGNLNDTSGRGNNAAYAHNGAGSDPNPTFVTGKIGQAFEFTTLTDGTKFDYATLGYPTDLQFGSSNALSISMWVNYTNQSDDLPFISNKDWGSSGNQGWGIFSQSAGDFRVNFTGANGGADKLDYHPTTVLRDGNWHNVVLSIARAPGSESAAVYTYVDGVPLSVRSMLTQGSIDTLNLPFSNSQGPNGTPLPTVQTTWAVNIGQDGTGVYNDGGGAYNIAAHIDDVGIWGRALSAKEANAIYTAGQAGKDLSQAVVVAVLAPTIASDPSSQVVSAGANVSLSVTAAGTAPFSYKWLKDGSPIGNATSSNLLLSAVTSTDAGFYSAVVSNGGGSATSRVAQVVVYSGSITQGLVAHLKFDGDYKDASGNSTDGSAVGTPTFQTGILGQAVHLTSAGTPANNPSPNNYVTLGKPNQLKFATNDFSFSFWTKIFSQNDDKPFISNKDWNSGSNLGWALATEGGGIKWNFRDNISSRRDSSTVAPQLEDGSWHHVVVSFFRGSSGSIYVDGQLVNSANIAPDTGKSIGSADTTNAVNIGQDGTGLYTDGGSAAAVDMLMDDVGIWQRVVTPQEALTIYNAGKAGLDLSQAGQQVTPSLTLLVSSTSGNISFTWTGAAAIRLQKSTGLSPSTWIDIPGTLGASSYSEPQTNSAAFYRLSGQ